MIRWIPYELHCHTDHSDGIQSLYELGENARLLGFKGVAVTDHNTISAFDEIDFVKENNNINILNGLEWTTFYGNVLLLGVYKYFEWRGLKLNNLDEKLIEPKNDGVVIGIANPFRVGNPINTKCYMEYAINNWENVDYIEVWSGTNPGIQYDNKKAFELWTRKLNEGHRIAGFSGRDWYGSEKTNNLISSTYIGIDFNEENSNEAILKALKKGRAVVSCSMLLEMSIEGQGITWNIGDIVYDNTNNLKLKIDISEGKVENNFNEDDESLSISVMSNKGCIKEINYLKKTIILELDNSKNILRWIRVELYRKISYGVELIAFTNPIYFEPVYL